MLSNTKKVRVGSRCGWKRSETCLPCRAITPRFLGHPGQYFIVWGLVWSMQSWTLKAQLDVLFSVPEVAQISLPVRALLAMDVPHFFLQHVGNESHWQAWKASGELGCVAGLFPREERAGQFFPRGQKTSLFSSIQRFPLSPLFLRI